MQDVCNCSWWRESAQEIFDIIIILYIQTIIIKIVIAQGQTR